MDPQNPTTQAPVDAALASAHTQTLGQTYSEAVDISLLCTLAGQSHLIADFLESNTPLAKVRTHLLALQAQSPEISSRLAPAGTATHATHHTPGASTANNPLILAAKARANLSSSMGGE